MSLPLTYVLPIRVGTPAGNEVTAYLAMLSETVEVIVVDGSPPSVFAAHRERWSGLKLTHIAPAADRSQVINGKVAGALSGIDRASHDAVLIADEDVRYDVEGLKAMVAMLAHADVVRPQNYFDPLPWHACLDTARTLVNRITGGDWPGTLGVRRSLLIAAGGYDGNVLFENLELVRTIQAAGGMAECPLDFYVRRLPPSTTQFWSQRVRQAYDELARPVRLALALAIVPGSTALLFSGRWKTVLTGAAATVAAAEVGRRIGGGRRVFPAVTAWLAPVWVLERGICAWVALASYLCRGGVLYHGRIVTRAATPFRKLRRRIDLDHRRLEASSKDTRRRGVRMQRESPGGP